MKNIIALIILIVITNVAYCQASVPAIPGWITKYGPWIGLLILVIEYILGKTKVIKANSIVETILGVLVKIGKAIIPSANK